MSSASASGVPDFVVEVARLRGWASTVPPDRRRGEWECDYEGWPSLRSAFEAFLARRAPSEWTREETDDVLYAVARDNEDEVLASALAAYPEHLLVAALASVEGGERDAKWQLAEVLTHAVPERAHAVLERLSVDDDDYVRRRVLLLLARLGSPLVEPLAERAWQSGDEHQRIAALGALHEVGSPRLDELLDELLARAEADGRPLLAGRARSVREAREAREAGRADGVEGVDGWSRVEGVDGMGGMDRMAGAGQGGSAPTIRDDGLDELVVRGSTIRLREVGPDDAAAEVALAHYFAELGARFPSGFEPGEAQVEPGARYVVGTCDGQPVVYGGVRPIETGPGRRAAEIKRMWVHPAWRGVGLGARMLGHLESLARSLGLERVVLDTNRTLEEAIALYERAGYRRIERYNDNPYAELFFEKWLPTSGASARAGRARGASR